MPRRRRSTDDDEAARFAAAGLQAYRDVLIDYVTLARTRPDTDPPLVELDALRTRYAIPEDVVAHEHAQACRDLLTMIITNGKITAAERRAMARVKALLGVGE